MSSIREVLFKVEQITHSDYDGECGCTSTVLFASTSRDRAIQWTRDRFGAALEEYVNVEVVGYADSDAFGYTWCGEIPPCLIWRHVYDVMNGEIIARNDTEWETRRADAQAEWESEVYAAATYV